MPVVSFGSPVFCGVLGGLGVRRRDGTLVAARKDGAGGDARGDSGVTAGTGMLHPPPAAGGATSAAASPHTSRSPTLCQPDFRNRGQSLRFLSPNLMFFGRFSAGTWGPADPTAVPFSLSRPVIVGLAAIWGRLPPPHPKETLRRRPQQNEST